GLSRAPSGVSAQSVTVRRDSRRPAVGTLVGADGRAVLQDVYGTAVRALPPAVAGHVDVDPRMAAPERHLGIGAVGRQVVGVEFDHRHGLVDGLFAGHSGSFLEDRAQTGMSQWR